MLWNSVSFKVVIILLEVGILLLLLGFSHMWAVHNLYIQDSVLDEVLFVAAGAVIAAAQIVLLLR